MSKLANITYLFLLFLIPIALAKGFTVGYFLKKKTIAVLLSFVSFILFYFIFLRFSYYFSNTIFMNFKFCILFNNLLILLFSIAIIAFDLTLHKYILKISFLQNKRIVSAIILFWLLNIILISINQSYGKVKLGTEASFPKIIINHTSGHSDYFITPNSLIHLDNNTIIISQEKQTFPLVLLKEYHDDTNNFSIISNPDGGLIFYNHKNNSRNIINFNLLFYRWNPALFHYFPRNNTVFFIIRTQVFIFDLNTQKLFYLGYIKPIKNIATTQ